MNTFTDAVRNALTKVNFENDQVEFNYGGYKFMFEYDNVDDTMALIDQDGEIISNYDYEDGGDEFIIGDAESCWNYWLQYVEETA